MTHSQRFFSATLSANDTFKLKYPRYLKGAVLVALVLTALLVGLWPDVAPHPYRLREKVELILLDIPDPVLAPEPPAPVAAPVIPPVIQAAPMDDPDVVDIDWEPMSFWNPAPAAEMPVPDDFVASSALPRLTFQAKADYPEIARRSGLEGTVLVHVLVDRQGRVAQVKVIQGVNPLLDKAAVAAARKCKFTPAKQRELNVRAWIAIPYRFRLR